MVAGIHKLQRKFLSRGKSQFLIREQSYQTTRTMYASRKVNSHLFWKKIMLQKN